MKAEKLIAIAAIMCALAIALGAFGAHALKQSLTAAALANWQTAVNYHLFHALTLLVLALWLQQSALIQVRRVFWGVCLGIVLFSGSLYVHSVWAWHPLVFLTPIGGVVWLLSWLYLAWTAYRMA